MPGERSLRPPSVGRYHFPVTLRNVERSGRRQVTKLSTIARTIRGVRHIDCDLIQYCPSCLKPQAFCEVKKVLVSDREWQQMRFHAKHWGHSCLALLVIEPDLGEIGVRIYDSDDDSITPVHWGGDAYLQAVLEAARDMHGCRGR